MKRERRLEEEVKELKEKLTEIENSQRRTETDLTTKLDEYKIKVSATTSMSQRLITMITIPYCSCSFIKLSWSVLSCSSSPRLLNSTKERKSHLYKSLMSKYAHLINCIDDRGTLFFTVCEWLLWRNPSTEGKPGM